MSKSSTESEYRPMFVACSETVWLRGLLVELDFSQLNPTPLHGDNTMTIPFFMSEQSILKWTAILFGKLWILGLSLFCMFPLIFSLLTYLPRL